MAMLHLIRFESFLRLLVVATIIISTLVYYLIQHFFLSNFPVYRVIFISSTVTAVLISALLSPTCYRWAWKILRRLNGAIFQDLNGTWVGTITPGLGKPLEVRAVIRQSLLRTEIDVHGESVKSVTLAASTIIEAGQYKIYYVYRAEPRKPKWPPYSGTTKFNLRILSIGPSPSLALSGQYYTDRDTSGIVELRQNGIDPLVDVSFY
jgi:hypothetical protein